ncbi:flagellar biosynthesis protein FlhF [Idiomarina xiamenensis]|uniref:flagellar biosynthesis protein FlhF n=1 Tax=Idiomarina xiamenensis TaxID=1207041 RepID=UPI0002E2408C|nr:flagellar biosynthesis protein FlhF [Idiomarina xiamenensis]
MKIKRFFAKDMRTALQQVKETLGADAVIMSNKRVNGGVELVAAIDPESRQAQPQQNHDSQPTAESASVDDTQPPAQSLAELLQRRQPQVQPEAKATASNNAAAPRNQAVAETDAENMYGADDSGQAQHLRNQFFPEMVANSAPAASDNQDIADLRAQIAGIRELLQHQVSGLMQQEIDRNEPTRALLIQRMTRMGISAPIADQIAGFVPENDDLEEAWEQTLNLLEGQLTTTRDDILARGGVVALVGPTGVGKTTTIAKLAARFAQRHGSDAIALISTDTFRIGATEQLQTYGRIIGCPVKVAKDAQELADVLLQLRQRKLILIDTAGMGQRDIRLSEQLATLMSQHRLRIRPYLVLSATAQSPVQNDIVRQFKQLPLAGCIFTKLDECMSLGEAISVMIEQGLPVSYLTDGQQVPEDIKAAEASFLVAEAERLYDKSICSNAAYVTESRLNPSL